MKKPCLGDWRVNPPACPLVTFAALCRRDAERARCRRTRLAGHVTLLVLSLLIGGLMGGRQARLERGFERAALLEAHVQSLYHRGTP